MLSVLKEDEIAPTVTCFPLMGVGEFIDNPQPFDASDSHSIYLPDYIINPHPRFGALTRNIRMRRGGKVDIKMPLFKDSKTPEFLRLEAQKLNELKKDVSTPPLSFSAADLDHAEKMSHHSNMEVDTDIHMDCMAFGMGMCCLQVTFQGRDVDESRYMYDQLAVLAPIMLAMTAATPIFKGRLSNVDARWDVIGQSVDDRTPAERGRKRRLNGLIWQEGGSSTCPSLVMGQLVRTYIIVAVTLTVTEPSRSTTISYALSMRTLRPG